MKKLYIIQFLLCLGWTLFAFRYNPTGPLLVYFFFVGVISSIIFLLGRGVYYVYSKLKKPRFFKTIQEEIEFDREFDREMKEALEE
jgi:hypothetical protein